MALRYVLISIIAAFMAACSSGSDSVSGSAEGLVLPNNLSIVTAQLGSTSTTSFKSLAAREFKAFDSAGTDYSNDPVNTYVYDTSMEALNTVNMILCLMEQTSASEMVNQGAYIALVNEDKCEQGENQSNSGQTGQASGGAANELNAWTVLSTRDNNSAAQVVKIWVPGETAGVDPMDAQTILVELTATEGVSAQAPFGSFSMNFKGVVDASVFGGPSGVEVELMKGSLQTVENAEGKPQFKFINLGGDSLASAGAGFGFEEAVNVILDDTDGTGGKAVTKISETSSGGGGPATQSSTYAIAFNNANLLRGKDDGSDATIDAQQCLSRTSFDTQVWRYNLYHRDDQTINSIAVSEGQRVDLNQGFPFQYDSDNDSVNDAFGWMGYHGIWTELGVVTDGMTVTEFDFSSNAMVDHTVNVSPGKMIRRTANTELLSDFQGDEFQFWGEHPTLTIFGQWIVTVDSSNDFQITGSMTWGDLGPTVTTTIDHDNNPGTAEVSVVATLTVTNNETLWLWSDALGGNVIYVHDNSVAANSRDVTFYSQEFVNPGDASLFPSGTNSVTLYCYDRCLKGGLTQGNIDGASSEDDLFHTYAGTAFTYTLSNSNGKVILTDDSNSQVVSAATLDMSSLGYDWGINTGEMVATQIANSAEPWLVYDASTSYRWETGPNEWNQHVTVSDSGGNPIIFDEPLRFVYTHSTANDANADNTYDGKKFLLEYAGAGQLHGFPWVEDTDSNRWYAAATLDDGTELTSGGNNYVVKAVEKEQQMQSVALGSCSALDVAGLLSDTELDLLTSSDIGSVSHTLAEKPEVTDAPAVIEGEVQ